jgi:hypothetical protein
MMVGWANALDCPASTVLGQQFGLQRQPALVGRQQPVAGQRQVLHSPADTKVSGIVRAGFRTEDAIGVSVAAGVLLGERGLVVPT